MHGETVKFNHTTFSVHSKGVPVSRCAW